MNPTLKIDNCIKMIDEVLLSINPIYYNIDARFDKERLLKWQTKINAIIGFKLLPLVELKIEDASIANKESCMSFMREYNIPFSESYFDAEWDVIKNYEIVTADDIRNEFWSLCPTPDAIPQYLNVVNNKFNKVLSRTPNKDDFSFENIVIGERHNNYNHGIRERQNLGLLTEKEADSILFFVHNTVDMLHLKEHQVKSIFDEFRIMAGIEISTKSTYVISQIPKELDTEKAKKLFEKAIGLGFMDSDYKWLDDDRRLLAYFVVRASEYLNLNKVTNADGTHRTSWKPFEALFNQKKLSSVKNEYMKLNTKFTPLGYENIDKIFI